jgi:hypothetical protein
MLNDCVIPFGNPQLWFQLLNEGGFTLLELCKVCDLLG